MFRINKITFHNYRNIFDSIIYLNEKGFETSIGGCMVGIYGTNGSSKSSVGYALCLFNKLVLGSSTALFHGFNNDFGVNDNYMTLEYDFSLVNNDSEYNGITIFFKFKKDENNNDKVYISEEKILLKRKIGRPNEYSVFRSNNPLDYNIDEPDMKKICELFSCEEKVVNNLMMSAIKEQYSFFLSYISYEQIIEIKQTQIKEFGEKDTSNLKEEDVKKAGISKQFSWLQDFVLRALSQQTCFIMPDAYGLSILNTFMITSGNLHTFFAPASNRDNVYSIVDENEAAKIEGVLAVSNNFINKIIKDFKVVLDKELIETTVDGVKKYKSKLLSIKNDGKSSFLFENESEGIKRLFLLSAALVRCVNEDDFILFVDEFDEGIFEVLFGDIIESLDKQCKGQIIFTSHNLRPLEVLNYSKFIFSTINPKNRFVTLKGIKPKNNLRDIYIRKIMYGDEEELSTLVDEMDVLEGLLGEDEDDK